MLIYSREKDVQSQTKSLWSFANHNRDLFLNPSYRGDVKRTQFSGKIIGNVLFGTDQVA